jgi:molybdopterin-guanine dinucleotide biosynthesis protein A
MGVSSARSRAGFVLAGGRSSRMGRDKALLPVQGSTLLEAVAAQVRAAAGSVVVIGPPERYAFLGLSVQADLIPNCGPLAAVYTALKTTQADWNLLVACDMPGVTAGFLSGLIDAAEAADAAALVPKTRDGLHPLCAVYHRRALAGVQSLIESRSLKMHDALSHIEAVHWPVAETSLLENVNTAVEWSSRYG